MARAMSSWIANASSNERSMRSDHIWNPVCASTSCAETRTRCPDRRTLPSSTDVTPSCSAIERTSTLRPLKANDELRAATRIVRRRLSVVMTSSVMPSDR